MSFGCATARELTPEYATGALDGRDRAAVEAHLASCAECRAEADTFVDVGDAVLALAPLAEPPLGFEAAVVSRLSGPARPPRRARAVALAAAAAVLVIGLGIGRLNGPSSTDLHELALTARGAYVGKAWVHDGNPGWIYVDMRSAESYDAVQLQVIDASGKVSSVGELALHDGHGTFGARSPVPVATVRTVRMIEPDGSIICQGRVET